MRNNTGQSLIEVLVAISIASLVILGLVKVTTSSVKNSDYSQDQSSAISVAQQKASEIIAIKNDNPLTFFETLPVYPEAMSSDEKFCIKTTLTNSDVPTGSPAGSKMVKINIDIFWKENPVGEVDCLEKAYDHNFKMETNVTN